MFAGMVRLESQGRSTSNIDSNSIHRTLHTGMTEGVPGVVAAGGSSRKRLQRRPGYMRVEPAKLPENTPKAEGRGPGVTFREASLGTLRGTDSDHHRGTIDRGVASGACLSSVIGVSLAGKLPSTEVGNKSSHCHGSGRAPSASYQENCRPKEQKAAQQDSPKLQSSPRADPGPGELCPSSNHRKRSLDSPAEEHFTSSFSFIRLSLSSSHRADATANDSAPHSSGQSGSSSSTQMGLGSALSDQSVCSPVTVVADKAPEPFLRRELGRDPVAAQWDSQEVEGDPAVTSADQKDCLTDLDSCSLDTEATSCLSVDSSDTASGSSVTSGYESATPCSDHGWDAIVKKYEGVLQDCLQNSRTNAKIESMMLKLQRLQQKAVLEDDYDTAERFGKKLEELRRERSSLKLGLPSRHPAVARFLERLRAGVQSALQETVASDAGESQEPPREQRRGSSQTGESAQCPLARRDRLLQEKQLVQEEMQELQRRLEVLQERSRQLDQEILQEEQLLEGEECEGPALRSCTPAQLQELSRALEDLVTSEHRAQIATHPPPAILRLKKQEQTLSTCIKEATAKVVMSQRLGGSLRRKVSASETQLLALHEAKLAAISGNDFSSAKELKAEMKSLYGERDRLEGLVKKLQALSLESSQELTRMKEEHRLLKQELEQKEAQFEKTQRENAVKYIEVLEDRLHSCGCPAVERVWEADLEACHLLLRGLQLRAPSCCGPGSEEGPSAPEPRPQPRDQPRDQPSPKQEQDCAMLTALGGRWYPEANLQHSEFTKKLEEFLFCMEDNQPEDSCSEAMEITERCELIGDKLASLEEQLQTAILDRNQALAHILSLQS
ncbi:hypothetical protein MATL_G00188910 [Megalops atlanticus]|uniref:Disrupted in schizophrenia 1 protein n=1 Tax=Megalops atlanticus TaxID=7932 RepID=A0A9D3T1M3_MEGAT|nr:hypothetical protein MATL_G00188910 [Megalops atlanticus]